MTKEELQAIRTRLEYLNATGVATAPRADAEALLAEVDRMKGELVATTEVGTEHMRREWEWALKAHRYQSENALLREIVQAVLATTDEAGDWVRCAFCGFRGGRHADECKREQARTALEKNSAATIAPDAGRSTPSHIKDGDHYWDAESRLWCYSEPSDTWKMREKPAQAALVLHTSARSYQRLVADFGPLHPYNSEEQLNGK